LDLNGRLISELENKITAGGQYQTLWNGRDYNGKQVASGIYFYRLTVISSQTEKAFTQSNKMLLLK
jgi:flagellar hook assembly protein FlgD